MSVRDFYEVLECSEEASYEELKHAFHKLILKYHPDKMQNSNTNVEEFHKIQEAWNVLSNSESRKVYDAEREQAKLEEETILLFAKISSDELYPKNEQFAYYCRCGSEYIVDKEDLQNYDHFYVACNECTFNISIQVNKNTLNLSSSNSLGT